MSELLERQERFTYLIAKLIFWAYGHGFEMSFADAYRNPAFAGILKYYKEWSKHCSRLAIDLNVFKNDVWLKKTEELKPLGEYWESLDPLCSWGGRWQDGNHFSFGEGKK